MHRSFFIPLSFLILFSSCHAQPASGFDPIAVVELFTSEGCSSCPPADRLLTTLTAATAKDHRKIFTLSFHVDYWDRLGWRDPFSSSAYSDRQRRYAEVMDLTSVYTPQIVVNGAAELVGSDESKLNKTVSNALKVNTAASFTKLNIAAKEGQKLSVSYEATGDLRGAVVHFALVSAHESTAVKRGENMGRRLDHTNVVRQFITQPAAPTGEAAFDTTAGDLKVIAYIQRTDDLHIIAAAEAQP